MRFWIQSLVAVGSIFPYQIANAVENVNCMINGRQVPCEQVQEQLQGMGLLLGIGAVFMAIWLLFLIITIVGGIFWLLMLIHASSHEIENKPLWIIILVFTNFLGALVYYFTVKRPFDAQLLNANEQRSIIKKK